MFANFAAKRHLTGPLRAVSPVETDDDIDWKAITRANTASRARCALPQPSAHAEKISQYVQRCFKHHVPSEDLTLKESASLGWVEIVSLLIPMTYIGAVLSLLSVAIYFFAEPIIGHVVTQDYLAATGWGCLVVLALGLLYVLLAPLFGGFKRYHGRVLQPHEAPALFDLIQALSKSLNVAAPKRIEINNETAMRVDAYAGINSIYRDEYKIVIGSPLLTSMDLPELTAMLAHELSHFQNKHKKVAFYLMHHVSEWLYYRAKGKDKRHQKLLRRMQSERLAFYEYIELWVWQRIHLSQQAIFMAMFSLHRLLTSWKCRQIELETDALAIRMSGSQAFIGMLKKLRLIQLAQSAVSKQNEWAWKEGFLLDNYASAVALEVAKSGSVEFETVKKNWKKECTRFCPDDYVRMQYAHKLNIKPVMNTKVMAKRMVENISKLTHELTLLDYESTGIVSPDRYCLSSEKIRQIKHSKDQLRLQAKRYFDGRVDARIIKFEPTEERDISNFDVQGSIDYIRRYRVEDRKQQASLATLKKQVDEAYVVQRLASSKLPVKQFINEKKAAKLHDPAYLNHLRLKYKQALHHLEVMDQVFYHRACMSKVNLDLKSSSQLEWPFHNLELYAQVRAKVASLEEAYLPLNLIVNGLQYGVTTKILQAGVAEKQIIWQLIMDVRSLLKVRPIQVQLNRKRVHLLSYLDFKLGALPEQSSDMTIQDVAEYTHELISLLRFQYHKWQDQLSVVLTQFEHRNDITPVNLVNV